MPWETDSLRVIPFALQKKMRLAVLRALSWTPREHFVWVSPSQHLMNKLGLSWGAQLPHPAGRGACEHGLVSPTPDKNECLGGPSPCSHACHNATGHFSCPCPTGFTLAWDHRNCRDEHPRDSTSQSLARVQPSPQGRTPEGRAYYGGSIFQILTLRW